LSDAELAARGVERCAVTSTPGFPDRIEMRDMLPGETALLLNFTHQPAATPYRASHAIFVREGAVCGYDAIDEVPEVLLRRALSLRAFDDSHMMRDAVLVTDREAIHGAIETLLGDARTHYIQAHYAQRGCYAARIARP
jgi:hypothetical protein